MTKRRTRRTGITPLQVLERQHGFLVKYQTNEDFRGYITGCFAPNMAWNSLDEERQPTYIDATLASFRYGEAYRVTPDMCDLVQFSADRLDETDKIDRTLAPSPFGFVLFEKPLPLWDARGELMLIHYLTWAQSSYEISHPGLGVIGHTSVGGFWVTMWNDATITPDETFLRLARMSEDPKMRHEMHDLHRVMGRYGFVGTQGMVDGEGVGPAKQAIPPETLAKMMAEDDQFREQGLDIPPPIGEHTNAARYVHALWLLLGQTLVDAREDPLSRAASKMAGRMNVPGKVTVIQLRRRETRKSEGETHVEWQHRWLCRGHWRWQPYANGRVERIWIAPYIKGPSDKPFKQSSKVYDLSR